MKRFFLLLAAALTACSGSQLLGGKDRFTHQQAAMIMAADSLTPMRVYLITDAQDSVLLRTPSSPIKADPEDKILQHFSQRLYTTVTDSATMGLGIAAPQVGILKNVILVQRLDKLDQYFETYLNPVIEKYSEETQVAREGCLSIPDRRDTLSSRSQSITISYDLLDGSHHTETIEGFTAVIFQHEIDHLRGILYTDHLWEERKVR